MNYIYRKIKELWLEHEILRKFTAVFSIDVLVRASAFLLLPVYLKLMTQTEFGLYNYWVSIVSLFFIIFSFGISIAQSKLFFDYSDNQKGDFLFTLNVLLFALLFVSLFIFYIFRFDFYIISILFKNVVHYQEYRKAILLGIVVNIYSGLLLNYFITTQNIKLIQFYNIARFLTVNILVILLLYLLKGNAVIIRLKYSYIFEIVLIIVFSYFYIKKMSSSFKLPYAIKILKIGIPYTLATIPGIAILFADKYYIEKFTDYPRMSVYYLAVTISSVIPIILASFQNIWMPTFFEEKNLKENIRKTKKLMRPLVSLLFLVSLFLFIGIKVLIITDIVSSDYQKVLLLLPIMFFNQIIVVVATIIQNYLVHFKRTDIILIINVLFLLPSVYLTKLLTYNYGTSGAAFAFLIINIFGLGVYYLVVKKFISLRFKTI